MMATAPDIKEGIIKEFLRCPICLDFFKNPRGLPCLHVICSECLEGWMKNKLMFSCPICNAATVVPDNGVLGFPVAFHINALQDFVQNCGPKRPAIACYNKQYLVKHGGATVKCLDCNVYYCNECNTGHKMAVVAAHHEVIPLSDLTQGHFEKASQKQISYCQQHQTCPLIYYCRDTQCQIPICRRCCVTRHKLHESIDLEEVSKQCREENNEFLETNFLNAEKGLKKRKDIIENEMKKIDDENDKNLKIIHDRYLKMVDELKEKEQKLISEAYRYKDEKMKAYQGQLRETDQKLSSLGVAKAVFENMTNFSPDDVIVKQHKGLHEKAKQTVKETSLPELWLQNTDVELTGKTVVDFKAKINTKSHKTVKCHNDFVNSIALLDTLIVALLWHAQDTPTEFFVHCTDEEKGNLVKEKLKTYCPQAWKMVSMKRDGKEVFVIIEADMVYKDYFKILNIHTDKCETVTVHGHYPYSLAVDQHSNIIFTNLETPKAIRKSTKGVVRTIFENKNGTIVLENPWHICVNTNNNIIVSDFGRKALIIFDATGTVLKTYDSFQEGTNRNPCGLCTDEQGNIYVCDFDGKCIHHFDKDGRFLGRIVTERHSLLHPEVVQYSNGMLVVGQSDGNVKYFKLS